LAQAKARTSELERSLVAAGAGAAASELASRENARLATEMAKLKEAQRGLVRALRPQIEKGDIRVDLNNERLLINLASGYLFGTGEDELKPAGANALKEVGAVLKDFPEYKVAVDGHTDNVAIRTSLRKKFPTNKELSEARAANAAATAVQVPTTINPAASRTAPTHRFAAVPPPRPPQSPSARKGFGAGQWLLAGAALGVFAGVLGLVLWLVFGQNRTGEVAAPSPTSQTPTSAQMTATAAPAALPGTDAQGFIDYPGARCDAGTSPAALARTTHSVLVVCRAGPGDFYYRGVRLTDGASIELANAVRSSGGFDVTNPTDGTRYQIRPDGLTIIPPDGQAITEPMVEYAAS